MCYACQTKYTVKHIVIICTDLAHIRKIFYSADSMKELFQKTEICGAFNKFPDFFGQVFKIVVDS